MLNSLRVQMGGRAVASLHRSFAKMASEVETDLAHCNLWGSLPTGALTPIYTSVAELIDLQQSRQHPSLPATVLQMVSQSD